MAMPSGRRIHSQPRNSEISQWARISQLSPHCDTRGAIHLSAQEDAQSANHPPGNFTNIYRLLPSCFIHVPGRISEAYRWLFKCDLVATNLSFRNSSISPFPAQSDYSLSSVRTFGCTGEMPRGRSRYRAIHCSDFSTNFRIPVSCGSTKTVGRRSGCECLQHSCPAHLALRSCDLLPWRLHNSTDTPPCQQCYR